MRIYFPKLHTLFYFHPIFQVNFNRMKMFLTEASDLPRKIPELDQVTMKFSISYFV